MNVEVQGTPQPQPDPPIIFPYCFSDFEEQPHWSLRVSQWLNFLKSSFDLNWKSTDVVFQGLGTILKGQPDNVQLQDRCFSWGGDVDVVRSQLVRRLDSRVSDHPDGFETVEDSHLVSNLYFPHYDITMGSHKVLQYHVESRHSFSQCLLWFNHSVYLFGVQTRFNSLMLYQALLVITIYTYIV